MKKKPLYVSVRVVYENRVVLPLILCTLWPTKANILADIYIYIYVNVSNDEK